MGGRRVDRLALPGRRPVAQAVVRRAQVRAALDHAARDVRPGLARHQAGGRVGDPRVARHTASVPRSLSVPLGGEVVARPLPDVAGHVEQAVAVGREALHRGRALPAVRHQVLPGELALPGVGHHGAAGSEVAAPGEDGAVQAAAGGELPFRFAGQLLAGPGRVGLGVLGGHMRDRVVAQPLDAAARAAWPPPLGTRHVTPPLGDVAQVHRAVGAVEDQRSGPQQGRVGAGVLRRVERALGDRHVPGRGRETGELGDGDRMVIHPEAVHLDPADRALLGVEIVRAHQETAPGHPRHAARR